VRSPYLVEAIPHGPISFPIATTSCSNVDIPPVPTFQLLMVNVARTVSKRLKLGVLSIYSSFPGSKPLLFPLASRISGNSPDRNSSAKKILSCVGNTLASKQVAYHVRNDLGREPKQDILIKAQSVQHVLVNIIDV